jgi:hypothetical protein
MSKSTHFFGQSVFGQLIELLDLSVVSQAIRETSANRYYKRFHTWDHLVSMLFGVYSHCTALREVTGGMMGLKGKIEHFGLKRVPHRSTLSDANRKRSSEVFAKVYYGLVNRYRSILSDSRFMQISGKKISIIDSSTIGLFKDILKCVGRKPADGKSKGGIKVHTEMILDEQVPRLIWYSAATSNDITFLKRVNFDKNNVYVFDKGYIDNERFEQFNTEEIGFVTRLKDNATFESIQEFDIPDNAPDNLLKDERIEVPIRKNGQVIRTVPLRRIAWWDNKNQRLFTFLTNLFELKAENVAMIYRQRWQIELIYKQLKQNFPLKYFLSDTENGITIQIWCVMIANLLLSVVRKQLSRKIAFSCLASYVRVNLINYIHLIRFLNHPEKDWLSEFDPLNQQALFPT